MQHTGTVKWGGSFSEGRRIVFTSQKCGLDWKIPLRAEEGIPRLNGNYANIEHAILTEGVPAGRQTRLAGRKTTGGSKRGKNNEKEQFSIFITCLDPAGGQAEEVGE